MGDKVEKCREKGDMVITIWYQLQHDSGPTPSQSIEHVVAVALAPVTQQLLWRWQLWLSPTATVTGLGQSNPVLCALGCSGARVWLEGWWWGQRLWKDRSGAGRTSSGGWHRGSRETEVVSEGRWQEEQGGWGKQSLGWDQSWSYISHLSSPTALYLDPRWEAFSPFNKKT